MLINKLSRTEGPTSYYDGELGLHACDEESANRRDVPRGIVLLFILDAGGCVAGLLVRQEQEQLQHFNSWTATSQDSTTITTQGLYHGRRERRGLITADRRKLNRCVLICSFDVADEMKDSRPDGNPSVCSGPSRHASSQDGNDQHDLRRASSDLKFIVIPSYLS